MSTNRISYEAPAMTAVELKMQKVICLSQVDDFNHKATIDGWIDQNWVTQ